MPWLDIVICETMGALQPDYHPFSHFISELGEVGRSTQRAMSSWWTIYTILFLPMCWQLFVGFRPSSALRRMALGFTVFVVSNGFLNAIFPCDAGCRGQTWNAKMHMAVSGIAFVMMISLPIRSAVVFQHIPQSRRFVSVSIAVAIIAILLSVVLSAVQLHLPFVPQAAIEAKGLLQRLRGGTFSVWISMLAVTAMATFKSNSSDSNSA